MPRSKLQPIKALVSIAAGAYLLAGLTVPSSAQSTPEEAVAMLFDAMRAADGNTLISMVVEGSMLDRTRRDGSHVRGSFAKWAEGIGRFETGDLDEQIFDVTVQQFGGIAQVNAPFMIYVKGELKGCGVNQFALSKQGDIWRFTYGMDIQYDGDCTSFKETYRRE